MHACQVLLRASGTEREEEGPALSGRGDGAGERDGARRGGDLLPAGRFAGGTSGGEMRTDGYKGTISDRACGGATFIQRQALPSLAKNVP
jgi:hypothetical protein